MATYTDDFNRADGALGAAWGTFTATPLVVKSNTATPFADPTGAWLANKYATALSTDDMEVEVTLGTVPFTDIFIYLRAATGGSSTLTEFLARPGGATSFIGYDQSVTGATADFDHANGDVIKAQVLGILSRLYLNGVLQLSWIDGAMGATRGASTRYVGIGVNPLNTAGGTFAIDSFTARDVTVDEITIRASGTAVLTASRSPSIAFGAKYVPLTNDVVVLFPSSTVQTSAITTPATWVNPLGGNTQVVSAAHQICCVYHLVTGAEQTAVTTTYTATNLYNAVATGDVSGIVLRGVDPANVIDSVNSTFAASVTPHVLASLTGTNLSTNSMVLSAVAKDATGAYATKPAGWTFANTSNTNQGRALLMLDIRTTAGVNVAATNITPSAADEYASITIAFTKLAAAAAAPALSMHYYETAVHRASVY